jgi:hypothetical protein
VNISIFVYLIEFKYVIEQSAIINVYTCIESDCTSDTAYVSALLQ